MEQNNQEPNVNTPPVKKRQASSKVSQRYRSFDRYLRMIQKEIHPSCKISASSLTALNSLVTSIFKRIASEASSLAQKQKRPTLMAHDIEFACRLVLPEELGKEVLAAGGTALTKFEDTLVREAADRADRRR